MAKKIEKTLELNITHEILSLADNIWWYLQPISLRWYWRPNWRHQVKNGPQSFATGLHINAEGKKGGGYDVCINSPSSFQGGNPRLLFMQFKAGVEQKFNSDSQSLFYGDKKNPSIHVEFDINSNANKNQHSLLQDLAKGAGNKDAVVYVFPRIVNQTQLEQSIGKLLTKTSFISIADIDNKASSNKININDKQKHKFRTCYHDYYKNEVNFFFFTFGRPEEPGGFLGEIFAIRLFRALQAYREIQLADPVNSKFYLINALVGHVLDIALYFSVSFIVVRDRFRRFEQFYQVLQSGEGFGEAFETSDIRGEDNIYLREIFDDVFNNLSVYFKWIESVQNINEAEIPLPPSNYSIDLNSDGIRFSLEAYSKADLGTVTYTLI